MEILLRGTQENNYKWESAVWKKGYYYITDELGFESRINETNILAVKNDERIGKVQCGYCGEIIENNSESIENHYATTEAKRNCLECDNVTIGRRENVKYTYTPNKDGTYNVVENFVANLMCDLHYWVYDINSETAKRDCIYTQCRRRGVREIDSIFVKYPEPFVRQITVDVLKAKKYPCEGFHSGYFVYDMRVRNTLKACVNEMGIVDHFIVTHRGWDYVMYYSDKYNKLFGIDNGKYRDNAVDNTSESKVNSTIKKISELFKEANGNDEK